jgi:hypothetical protein
MEVGVHTLARAERADLSDRVLGSPDEAEGLFFPDALDQRLDLRPPRERKAAVSPRRAAAADVLLDHNDVRAGFELLDSKGGPKPRIAAADDADVGLRVLEDLLRLDAVLGVQGLLEPE